MIDIYKAENFTFSVIEENDTYDTNFCVSNSTDPKECPVDAKELKGLANFILGIANRTVWGIQKKIEFTNEKFCHEYAFKCKSHAKHDKNRSFEYEFKILKFKFGQENFSIKIPRELIFLPATGFGEKYRINHCLSKEQFVDLANFIYEVLVESENPKSLCA